MLEFDETVPSKSIPEQAPTAKVFELEGEAEDGLETLIRLRWLFSGESIAQQILLSNALSDLDRKFIVHGSYVWTVRTLITASSAKFHGKMLT